MWTVERTCKSTWAREEGGWFLEERGYGGWFNASWEGKTDTFATSSVKALLNRAFLSEFASQQWAPLTYSTSPTHVCALDPWCGLQRAWRGVTHDPRLSAGLQAINIRDCLLPERKKEIFLISPGIKWKSPPAQKPAQVAPNGALSNRFSPGRWICFIFHQKHRTYLLSNELDT